MNTTANGDRAGHTYWDEGWKKAAPARVIDPRAGGRWNFPNRELERFLHRWIGDPAPGSRLIELGCARSIWLPYFARAHGYVVSGIDYSEVGCEQSRQMLLAAGVHGDVVCGDFFNPPEELAGSFDTVFSYGVAEHFDDTAGCIAKFSRYLAPGGRIITIIPNVRGFPGFLQKHVNKSVYDKHVPLSSDELELAHRQANLHVESAGYLVSSNPGVLNLSGLTPDSLSVRAKRLLLNWVCRMSSLTWYVDEHLFRLPATQLLGAYAYCVAKQA